MINRLEYGGITEFHLPWGNVLEFYVELPAFVMLGLAIAEINFGNAKRNPRAQTRGWQFPDGCFSDNDELNPVIDGTVRKMDCGQITDGAACVILAGEQAAAEHAAKQGLKLVAAIVTTILV